MQAFQCILEQLTLPTTTNVSSSKMQLNACGNSASISFTDSLVGDYVSNLHFPSTVIATKLKVKELAGIKVNNE